MANTIPVEFRIARFNPETDEKPVMKSYTIQIPEGGDLMILAALHMIKDQFDDTLTFRRSCGEGVCGSDGMNINGKNRLACITPISSLKQPIEIRPLPSFPIVRDLVVDMTSFNKQASRMQTWLINDEDPPARERLQTPEQRAKLDGLYECIQCGCCSSACPSFWWNHNDPERFVGPAGLLAVDRFLSDSRDTALEQRLEMLGDPDSAYACRTIMNCANVCPKGLNPAKAISHIRELMVKHSE